MRNAAASLGFVLVILLYTFMYFVQRPIFEHSVSGFVTYLHMEFIYVKIIC